MCDCRFKGFSNSASQSGHGHSRRVFLGMHLALWLLLGSGLGSPGPGGPSWPHPLADACVMTVSNAAKTSIWRHWEEGIVGVLA